MSNTRIGVSHQTFLKTQNGTSPAVVMDIEILVKQFYDPLIRKFINDYNDYLANNTDTTIRPLRFVIAGGEAFNFYFKPDRVIETHDYDLRILSLDSTFYSNTNSYDIMRNIRDTFTTNIIRYIFNQNTLTLFDTSATSSTYTPTFMNIKKSRLVSTIDYNIGTIVDTIIDVSIYHPSLNQVSHMLVDQPEDENTPGFTKNFLVPVIDYETNLLYVKLGYLIWDTVRMLDQSRQEIRNGTFSSLASKYERYKEKYRYLIKSLNDPETYVNRAPLANYYMTISSQMNPNFNNCRGLDKVSLIRQGIANGLFPSTLDSSTIYDKFTSNYICEQGIKINSIKAKLAI